MNYPAIILSIVLISVCYTIYETNSAYAMQTIQSNWDKIIHPSKTSETEKEATMILRDSKATSFVPTFKFDNNAISETSETEKEATMILRDSKATSFVPTFKFDNNTISESHELPNKKK